MKIGILVPSSTPYPAFARSFTRAVKAGIQCAGLTGIEFAVEDVGSSGAERHVKEKISRLVLQEEVSAAIAFTGEPHFSLLNESFNANETPLLVSGFGANMPLNRKNNPFVFSHSLDFWASAWQNGKLAADRGLKKLVLASTFYDSGYQMTSAFLRAFTEAGGDIMGWFTHQHVPSEQEFKKWVEDLSKAEIDTVYACLSRDQAVEFSQKLEGLTLPKGLQFFPSVGMHLSPFYQQLSPAFMAGKEAILPWIPGTDHSDAQQFTKSLAEIKQRPNFAALVGWESGLLLGTALSRSDGYPDSIAEELKKVEVQGVRGKLKFDTPWQGTLVNQYHAVNRDKSGKSEIEEIAEMPFDREGLFAGIQQEAELHKNQQVGGWVNPYLFI